MSDTVEAQLFEICSQYFVVAEEALEKELKAAAKVACDELRANSPANTGEYRKGWKVKRDGRGYIVYNATYPWKTHLLENGHIKRGGKGRVKAIKHIEPAAEKGLKYLIKEIRERLEAEAAKV